MTKNNQDLKSEEKSSVLTSSKKPVKDSFCPLCGKKGHFSMGGFYLCYTQGCRVVSFALENDPDTSEPGRLRKILVSAVILIGIFFLCSWILIA